jgi:hypothetical protein
MFDPNLLLSVKLEPDMNIKPLSMDFLRRFWADFCFCKNKL